MCGEVSSHSAPVSRKFGGDLPLSLLFQPGLRATLSLFCGASVQEAQRSGSETLVREKLPWCRSVFKNSLHLELLMKFF